MCKEDKDVIIGNSVGNISNSRIDQINQIVANISDLPEKFQEPILLWLELSKEDLLWKKEQRERMQRIERETQKANFINERKRFLLSRTLLWSKIFFVLEIILACGWYLYKVHAKLPVTGGSDNKLIDYLTIIWYDYVGLVNNIPPSNYFIIPFFVIGFFIIASLIAFFFGRLVARHSMRKFKQKQKEDFV